MNTQKENSATALTKTNRRYAFAQKEGEDHTCIKLTEGQFADVIYKYGKVGIPPKVEEDAEGKLPLTFDYTVVKNPKDLYVLWDQMLSDDIKYLYETAEIWQPMDKTIKSVSPKFTGKAPSKPN